jgi:DNA mismatch repair protein MutL
MDSDNIIALLDDTTANRIAAGEVVERPSSVVKELVENSIDAGANRIEIELEEGGKRKIIIRDNGSGMSREDAVLSLQRHATSKIRTADDLFSIFTLGFRGEAVPSIASVSDFVILTKRSQDETATQIRVMGGDIVSVEDAGAPDGTTITVENLFATVPARLKFLKTTQTELNHIVDFVQKLILAYPKLSFVITHDGYEMLGYAGSNDPRHALAAVWGRDTARAMVEVTYDSPSLSVKGYVSKPSVSKATRSAQAFFVNGRNVRSRTVQHAFDAAFKKLMTTDRHPVATIFITIAPELVDVNVHPAKTEVRFTRDGDVYSAVHKAVESALLTGGLVPEVKVTLPPMSQTSTPSIFAPDAPLENNKNYFEIRGNLPPRTTLSSYVELASPAPISPPDALTTPQDALVTPNHSPLSPSFQPRDDASSTPLLSSPTPYIGFDGYAISRLRVLGQSRNTYIVAETDDAILFIDQHIAHERVLYERMMNGAMQKADQWGVIAQHLVVPQTLELATREARVVTERLSALEKAGFILEAFGGETFIVRAVPATIAHKSYLETLKEIIDEMTQTTLSRRLLVPHESAVIMASCKMAVKKGDPLMLGEMTSLLQELAEMQNPFTCPHGRPVLIALTHHEMDRKFHRIGPH